MGLEVRIKTRLNGFVLDVDWEIGEELVVLFGYSGSGKSVTLKTIAGVMHQDDGCIRLNGKALFDRACRIKLPPQQRSVGYVFQDLALFPHMTVEQNILFGAKDIPRRTASKSTEEMIELFRLSGLEKRYPHEISGGQRQRVAFARALIRRPQVLLLDEPFSSLDNPLRMEMRQCLTNVARSRFRIPAVMVTHDVLEAYMLADRILVYSDGQVIQSGSPKEVFDTPSNQEIFSQVKDWSLFQELLYPREHSVAIATENLQAGIRNDKAI
jgi:molybdate transport system ATP-binding protein